jgi:glucosamine 6-phosphate synthetase-like amidotransferase/phosphosugar isomerase protein
VLREKISVCKKVVQKQSVKCLALSHDISESIIEVPAELTPLHSIAVSEMSNQLAVEPSAFPPTQLHSNIVSEVSERLASKPSDSSSKVQKKKTAVLTISQSGVTSKTSDHVSAAPLNISEPIIEVPAELTPLHSIVVSERSDQLAVATFHDDSEVQMEVTPLHSIVVSEMSNQLAVEPSAFPPTQLHSNIVSEVSERLASKPSDSSSKVQKKKTAVLTISQSGVTSKTSDHVFAAPLNSAKFHD